MVALMLGSTLLIERSVVLEIQQNLDNCIGESGKTKHLIEARWQKLKSLSQLVILFLRAETF